MLKKLWNYKLQQATICTILVKYCSEWHLVDISMNSLINILMIETKFATDEIKNFKTGTDLVWEVKFNSFPTVKSYRMHVSNIVSMTTVRHDLSKNMYSTFPSSTVIFH